jgi:hypothetical protein
MTNNIYIIEKLSIIYLIKILTYVWVKNNKYEKSILYYINSTRGTYGLMKLYKFIFSDTIHEFRFNFENVVDINKSAYGFKKIHENIGELWGDIYEKQLLNSKLDISQSPFTKYLMKNALAEWPSHGDEESITKLLLMIHAIANYKQNKPSLDKIYFIIEKRLWMRELMDFALKLGVELISVKPIIKLSKAKLKNKIRSDRWLIPILYNLLNLYNRLSYISQNVREKNKLPNVLRNNNEIKASTIIVDQVMQYFGHSSFWRTSGLPKENLIFASKNYTIRQKELAEMRSNEMCFLPLSRSGGRELDTPTFNHKYTINLDYYKPIMNLCNSWEQKYIEQQKYKYITEKNYWTDLFKTTGAKIYATHHKWSSYPIAASEAIIELGGVSALWQTSFYETMGLHSAINSDIYFSFSSNSSKLEKLNDSSIKYIVGVGYIFDFNFISAKQKAKKIKHYLKNNNARKIISIFDGGSSEDERWSVSNASFKKDYQFILEKVLNENWLGLIIKSKKPGSLRKRLGNVSEILERAIKTGRCYFSEDVDYGEKNLSSRPAVAAYASDIAIHLCLYASSAGLEAALTGTPTLLLDKYNLKDSQFYKLDKNKVVFHDLSEMWDAIMEHWQQNPIPGFGDWSPIIDDLDPFKDGKAAHRVNSFLLLLLNGFKAGYEREKILEQSVETYGKQWGYDKINFVNEYDEHKICA